MKILRFSDDQSWLDARLGKFTGSRLADIIVKRGTGEKIGFYETIAERLATKPDSENRMARGHRLEEEALVRFEKETGKKVNKDLVLWQRDDNPNIAVSPDGSIEDSEIPNTEACEVKCLSSANHIKTYLSQEIPEEYKPQTRQYFIVNDTLAKLYVCFYDPRMSVKDFFFIEVTRAQIQPEIDELLEMQRKKLEAVEEIVIKMIGL